MKLTQMVKRAPFALLGLLALALLPSAAMASAPENLLLPNPTPHIPRATYPVNQGAGTWTPKGYTVAWQWQRCNASGGECANIAGATSSSYTPTTKYDVGKTLRALVTATNSEGSTQVTGATTGVVVALGAAPAWRINGKTLAEKGISKETFEGSGGTLTLQVFEPEVTFECKKQTSSGTISGVDGGEVSATGSECKEVGAPNCKVEEVAIAAQIKLILIGNKVYEKFTEIESGAPLLRFNTSGTCPWLGTGYHQVTGSFAAEVQSELEAVNLQSSASKSAEEALGTSLALAGAKAWLSGASTAHVNGANLGYTLGAW